MRLELLQCLAQPLYLGHGQFFLPPGWPSWKSAVIVEISKKVLDFTSKKVGLLIRSRTDQAYLSKRRTLS